MIKDLWVLVCGTVMRPTPHCNYFKYLVRTNVVECFEIKNYFFTAVFTNIAA